MMRDEGDDQSDELRAAFQRPVRNRTSHPHQTRIATANIQLLTVRAPVVAAKIKRGQFVIIRVNQHGERIPLTVVPRPDPEIYGKSNAFCQARLRSEESLFMISMWHAIAVIHPDRHLAVSKNPRLPDQKQHSYRTESALPHLECPV